MKLPDNVPVMIVHCCEPKRPDGADVMRHVVPWKSEPATVTVVPTGPEVGFSAIVGT